MRKKNYLSIFLAMVFALTMAIPTMATTDAKSILITGRKTVYVGKTIELESRIFPGYVKVSDYNIEWSSSNSKIAKVLQYRDDDTKIKGVKAGKAKITVKIRGTNIKATYKITVKKVKKSKSSLTTAKKTLKSYKKKAKSIKTAIKKIKLDQTVTGRRQQYYSYERKINAVENKLDRMDDKWESKYELGKVSYKSYRTIARKIESVEDYLEIVEDYLDRKFLYEFND